MHSGPGSLHDISVQFTHFHNRSVEKDDVVAPLSHSDIVSRFLSIHVVYEGNEPQSHVIYC